MKRRFVQIEGELVEVTQDYAEPLAPLVMGDIQPYKSMIDGSEITSRSRHREHLRDHGCIEYGNDPSILNAKPQPIPDANPEHRKELIRSQVASMRHEDFRRMIGRDLDRIRWESRGRTQSTEGD